MSATIQPNTNAKGMMLCPNCDGTKFQRSNETETTVDLTCECSAEWQRNPEGLLAMNELAQRSIGYKIAS